MLLEAIAELDQAGDVLTLRRGVVSFARSRGFEAVFFLSPIARNTLQGRILANAGFDPAWASAYSRSYFRIDPLPDIALTLKAPFRWGQAGLHRQLSPAERDYLDRLEHYGMGDGLAYPLFGSGARAGLVGFGRHPDLGAVSRTVQVEIQLMLQSTYQTYCRIIERDIASDAELSERERDVLYWLTQSKSNSAIAAILAISPATVDTYMRRIFRKLGVADRVGAAIAAVQQGHIIPGGYRREPEHDPAN